MEGAIETFLQRNRQDIGKRIPSYRRTVFQNVQAEGVESDTLPTGLMSHQGILRQQAVRFGTSGTYRRNQHNRASRRRLSRAHDESWDNKRPDVRDPQKRRGHDVSLLR